MSVHVFPQKYTLKINKLEVKLFRNLEFVFACFKRSYSYKAFTVSYTVTPVSVSELIVYISNGYVNEGIEVIDCYTE